MYNFNKKKVRGQKRRVKYLLDNIDKLSPDWNFNEPYDYFHVPGGTFIQANKVSPGIKRLFCKKWLEKTYELIEQKPQTLTFCKVVSLIQFPYLWESQIIIFYDKEYYDDFWTRNNEYQKWERIHEHNLSLLKSKNMTIDLNEQGYKETIIDDNEIITSILWFYGELKD